MNDEQLAAIEARTAAATPGPWIAVNDPELAGPYVWRTGYPYADANDKPLSWGGVAEVANDDPREHSVAFVNLSDGNPDWYGGPEQDFRTAQFIAHARTDVELLLAEVRRLRAKPVTSGGDPW